MDTMQAEALRRAQEMHSKTQHNTPFDSAQRKPLRTPAVSQQNNQPEESHKDTAVPKAVNTPQLFEDKEKLLILVLILILINEETSDISVVLALLYLII